MTRANLSMKLRRAAYMNSSCVWTGFWTIGVAIFLPILGTGAINYSGGDGKEGQQGGK
jgi:hypothetical protein